MAEVAIVAVGSRTEVATFRSTPLFDREVWHDALLVWLGQHALLLLVAYVGVTLTRASKAAPTLTWSAYFSHIGGWDASLYAFVARDGYTGGGAPAFAPALLFIERGGMLLTGLDPATVGLIVSNLAMLGALGLLGVLARQEVGRAAARRTVLCLAIFPTAFFLDIAYTESLFLLFSVGAFLAIRGRRWILAGILSAAAALTRPLGLLLLIPIVVTIWESSRAQGHPLIRDLVAMVTAVVLPCVALGSFMLYLYSRYGTLFAESRAEELVWGRGLGVPFLGFVRAGAVLLGRGLQPDWFQAHILLDMAFSILFIMLALATWRRLPPVYSLYTIAMLLLVMSESQHNWYALGSNMRFMLVVFPIFMLLGQWGERRSVEQVILLASVPLLAILTVLFLNAAWVA